MRFYPHEKLEIIPALSSFYMLEEIIHTPLRIRNPFMELKIKDLKKRAQAYQDKFSKHLARALFDYLTSASYGEARWANEKCEEMHPEILVGGERHHAYEEARMWKPKSMLKTLSQLFGYRWEDGYGGHPWKTIVDHAMHYFTMSPKQFVDYVVDLSHNGGCAFDKPIVVKLDDITFYKIVLDAKLHGSLMLPWIDKTEREMSRHKRLLLDTQTYILVTEAIPKPIS
jgi:hypothetical protein